MKKLIYFSLLLSFMGCTSQIVKKDRLDQVKSVAIIGLDLEQQKSISTGDLLSIAMKTNSSSKMVAGVRENAIHLNSVYNDIAEKVSRKTGWKVISLSELQANEVYAKDFKDKTEGFQTRPFINERFNLFTADGVLDTFPIQNLNADALRALAQSLRVDALIIAKSVVRLNNSSMIASLVGKGEFHPSSSTTLTVLDGTTGEKIFLKSADGPEVENGEKNFIGMAAETRINEMAQKATASSVDLLVKDL